MSEQLEAREPMVCPTCGEVHTECSDDLLMGMYLTALGEAKRRLSAEGLEVLQMVNHAVDVLGLEAWDDAENIENLTRDEVEIIRIFFARMTLIDHAREGLYQPTTKGEEEDGRL